jgi:hypothetical protein
MKEQPLAVAFGLMVATTLLLIYAAYCHAGAMHLGLTLKNAFG